MKSYRQFCSVACSLDVVGDRWALLVVRELLLGPCRYTDLLTHLPGVGTNVLSTRLRDLEQAGVVERRRLPAPTPTTLYQLTDEGRGLRPVIDALAHWGGNRLTTPGPDDATDPAWFALSLYSVVDPTSLDDGSVFELHVDDTVVTLAVDGGTLTATRGATTNPSGPTTTLTGQLRDFFRASRGDRDAAGQITVTGEATAGRAFLKAITRPAVPAGPNSRRST